MAGGAGLEREEDRQGSWQKQKLGRSRVGAGTGQEKIGRRAGVGAGQKQEQGRSRVGAGQAQSRAGARREQD